MRQPWLLALVLLPACIVAHPRRAAPPPPRPAHPVVVAPPPSRPPPPVIVHPQVAIDAQGAASIAQSWAWQKGWPSSIKKVDRERGGFEVNLKIKGNGQKGRARVFVDEWSGALSIREQDVRAHDKGGHSGHGRGHGHHDDRDDDD